jgi:hypothetical protein
MRYCRTIETTASRLIRNQYQNYVVFSVTHGKGERYNPLLEKTKLTGRSEVGVDSFPPNFCTIEEYTRHFGK